MIKIANFLGVSVKYLMTGREKPVLTEPSLTLKDEHDIAKDLELFAGQLELMLRRSKAISKEKYSPN